jgi:hypothetical protein
MLRGRLWDVRLYQVAGGRIQFIENLTNFSLNIGKNPTIQYHLWRQTHRFVQERKRRAGTKGSTLGIAVSFHSLPCLFTPNYLQVARRHCL